MKLNVFFLPSAIISTQDTRRDIYIVIDVIRATTSIAVMLDRGARRIYVAGSIEQARAARQLYPERLLCGERHVKPLPGFDYGNSPVQFAAADLRDRELIMTTTNGTRAFHACPSEAIRLAGSLYNAEAVAGKALELAAAREGNIHLVCSGEEDAFGLDDAVCAGCLVQEIQNQIDEETQTLELHESALAALALSEAYPPPELVEFSNASHQVIEGGLLSDISFCMRASASQSVGLVTGQEERTGLLLIERA